MGPKLHRLLLSGVLAVSSKQAALACAFHGYTPAPTLVDMLLSTEQVVVARPDLSTPNRFAVVETLMGPETLYVTQDAAHRTNANQSADQSAMVLLARDGAYGPWLKLAVLDGHFKDIVDQIIQKQSAWLHNNERDRLAFFAGHLNHPNGDIRRLALQELDRVSYGLLRDVQLPEIRNLKQDLRTGDEDFTPIRVLLAGLSKDTRFGAFLANQLDYAVENNVPYMGAYATAWIELEEEKAIQRILSKHLANRSLPAATHEKLLEAIALQYRNVSGTSRRKILHAVLDVLQSYPELRDAATRSFGLRSNWVQHGINSRKRVAKSSPQEPIDFDANP